MSFFGGECGTFEVQLKATGTASRPETTTGSSTPKIPHTHNSDMLNRRSIQRFGIIESYEPGFRLVGYGYRHWHHCPARCALLGLAYKVRKHLRLSKSEKSAVLPTVYAPPPPPYFPPQNLVAPVPPVQVNNIHNGNIVHGDNNGNNGNGNAAQGGNVNWRS
ncbi:hypothetical protein OQA88_5440 [Cercophora sp. LCS_1]